MGNRVHRVRRTVPALAIVVACFGTAGAAAQAATLKVTVSPAQIHKGDDYKISVNGSYGASEVTAKAYLISVIQYSSAPCRATAQLENSRAPQFYFAPKRHPQRVGIFVGQSPFSRTDSFKAASPSTRRVCAYLYPKQIGGANDPTAPIATASARYKVTTR